ncbi:autoinducer binding domain-containing protein [Chelatococcus daeguensis]|uniref:PA1136 family autoinducer-binding transcriptional regulator n=1 Tax=Chelatococcus daeguensis TaxID=444444 RepID=UPI0007AB8BD0|nr:PA1136 family autoinducer-binding transcriptional regulator [Chelatococcus daeguensis]KZE31240.1 LuxR family transcriptional regulator [Chelatococcus daeguensis]MBM3082713.1 autoinducer binding domain-containing protein [Chelatococcus daeguensis]
MSVVAAETALRSVLAIEGAEELAAIENEVRAYAAPLGYDRFVLFSASAAQDEVLQSIYWVEGDWFGGGHSVDAETYVRRCPVTRHILEAREPFFWTKTVGEDGDLYRVVRVPRGRGIHGLQVPVFGPLGLEGAMSLGGERIDAAPQARLTLGLIAVAAFFAARRILEAPTDDVVGRLSDRERQVLTWTAAGRRQVEIAATLGLSERTVENHLRRIRKRLGVTTTAQAIRVAIRNGEIAA